MSECETISEHVRRILAPNPSPLTGNGTNSYLIGKGQVALVDPGPALPEHYEAILGALGRHERISAILVTHPHLDHSELAPALAKATGAPIYAAGRAQDGKRPVMQKLAQSDLADGGEGLDKTLRPTM